MKDRDIVIEVGSQWYNRVASEIEQYRITMNKKDAKRYKLDLLLRVAKRIDEFSQTCGECEAHKKGISAIVQEMSLLVQMPSKEGLKRHLESINRLVEHLKKEHRMVERGHYLGMGIGIGMAIGAGIGTALGAAFDNPGIGTGFGIALGVAIGSWLDKKARDEGRVL